MTTGDIFFVSKWWIKLSVYSGYTTVATDTLHQVGLKCDLFAASNASLSSWSFLISLFATRSIEHNFYLLPWIESSESLIHTLHTTSSSIAVTVVHACCNFPCGLSLLLWMLQNTHQNCVLHQMLLHNHFHPCLYYCIYSDLLQESGCGYCPLKREQ